MATHGIPAGAHAAAAASLFTPRPRPPLTPLGAAVVAGRPPRGGPRTLGPENGDDACCRPAGEDQDAPTPTATPAPRPTATVGRTPRRRARPTAWSPVPFTAAEALVSAPRVAALHKLKLNCAQCTALLSRPGRRDALASLGSHPYKADLVAAIAAAVEREVDAAGGAGAGPCRLGATSCALCAGPAADLHPEFAAFFCAAHIFEMGPATFDDPSVWRQTLGATSDDYCRFCANTRPVVGATVTCMDCDTAGCGRSYCPDCLTALCGPGEVEDAQQRQDWACPSCRPAFVGRIPQAAVAALTTAHHGAVVEAEVTADAGPGPAPPTAGKKTRKIAPRSQRAIVDDAA